MWQYILSASNQCFCVYHVSYSCSFIDIYARSPQLDTAVLLVLTLTIILARTLTNTSTVTSGWSD